MRSAYSSLNNKPYYRVVNITKWYSNAHTNVHILHDVYNNNWLKFIRFAINDRPKLF